VEPMPEPPEPTRRSEPLWLEPYPDAMLDTSPGPEARYELKEAVSLAFVTALQHLPPRQRAVLVLRDVLGFRAAEVADMLETSEAAVKGALQRARATLETRLGPGHRERAPLPRSARERRLVARFAEAVESGDVDRLVALLTGDAWLTMPPQPFEYQGHAAIARFLHDREALRGRPLSLVPTRANGQPAFGCYLLDDRAGVARPRGLMVLTLEGDRISAITWFGDSSVFSHFGLPRTLSGAMRHHRRMSSEAILVTGATGNAGGAVVSALVAGGHPVRALVRAGGEAALPAGVEPVVGDLNRPETFADALAGVRSVFLLSGYERMQELLAELRDAGVERIVLLSSSGVPGGDMSNAVARYHILSEQAVRESGIAWTFLQPNSFMSNALRWLPQLREGDVVKLPFADVAIATIDPADLAAVAVKALTTGELAGRSLRLSGPEALYPADQVRILGAALGRELRPEPLSNEAAREEMSAAMPVEYVDAFFSFFVDGTVDETTVLPTVREVLGREPGTFERWAAANVEAFR
jgi:RNA polymerase sigma-70 factor (TIGR02960 family)